MTTLAADTWGIPGPAFAALYPFLLIGAIIVVVAGRRRVGSSVTPPSGRALTPTEIAYLRGGSSLAVATSLGELRAEGALDDRARPVATSMTKNRLDAAVLGALRAAGDRKSARQVSTLATNPNVVRVLHGVRDDLARRGLIRSAGDNRLARGWSVVLWAVVALGVLRGASGVANDKPVTFVVFETLVATVAALVATFATARGPNTAGRAAIADARRANTHLDPKLQPSWATYGAAGAGMSIALFGAGALVLAQPAFADTVAAKQLASGGSGDGGSSTSSSCGGGSSCSSGCGGGCGG